MPELNQAIDTYQNITASPEFRELERMRAKAQHDEAQALWNAEQKGYHEADEKWQGIVAEMDAEIARLRAQLEGRN